MVKQLTEKEIAERKAFFRDRLKCCKAESLCGVRITELENWVDRILDELIENIYGEQTTKPISKDSAAIFATAKDTRAAILKAQQTPTPVRIDEVAHAFFNSSRVESWEVLGEEYAGHKIGAIYSFVLELIEKHIGESMCIKSEQIISKEEV